MILYWRGAPINKKNLSHFCGRAHGRGWGNGSHFLIFLLCLLNASSFYSLQKSLKVLITGLVIQKILMTLLMVTVLCVSVYLLQYYLYIKILSI